MNVLSVQRVEAQPGLFEQLAVTRRRVTNGFEWLQGHLDGNQPGVRKLTALIVREYMPALNAYRERLTPEEREALAVAYAKKVDGAADDDEYAARLNDYMVAADIADQTTLSWMLASVRLWEEAGQ